MSLTGAPVLFAALDVEGAESAVLRNFPFEKHAVRVITVERPKPSAQEMLADNGFRCPVYVPGFIRWKCRHWNHLCSFYAQMMDLWLLCITCLLNRVEFFFLLNPTKVFAAQVC